MPIDLPGLLRRDHDDMDRVLLALLAPTTSRDDAAELIDALRIGLAAHSAAERAVMWDLWGPLVSSRVIAELVRTVLDEHRAQTNALAALAWACPRTSEWRDSVLELRIALLDHATREEFAGIALFDDVAPERRRAAARAYATERLRRFAYLDVAAPATVAAKSLAFN